MPIHDYKCRGCGEEFEFLLLKTTVAACPSCGKRDLEQLPTARIAISTAASRQSNFNKAQRALSNSDEVHDRHNAEIAEFKEHAPQMLRPIKKKRK